MAIDFLAVLKYIARFLLGTFNRLSYGQSTFSDYRFVQPSMREFMKMGWFWLRAELMTFVLN